MWTAYVKHKYTINVLIISFPSFIILSWSWYARASNITDEIEVLLKRDFQLRYSGYIRWHHLRAINGMNDYHKRIVVIWKFHVQSNWKIEINKIILISRVKLFICVEKCFYFNKKQIILIWIRFDYKLPSRSTIIIQ